VTDSSEPTPSQATNNGGFVARLTSYAAEALRFWEPKRLVYNGVLGLVVVGHFILGWPGSRQKLSFDFFLGLFILAVLANIVYCAAYIPDLFVRFSGLHGAWRRGRVILLIIGTGVAATFAHFIARAMFNA
jgi:hypothetical protein